jgi:uncharacterized membrane protein (DUF373 family)
MTQQFPRNLTAIRREWAVLTFYQRFEATVAMVLTLVIGAVILVAMVRLVVSVIDTLVLHTMNPLDHPVFQQVFGEIMTVLIALEFNHTLQHVISRERGIIQAKIVILIALLALARKVIVADLSEQEPTRVAALAFMTLALGVTYWLMRERDDQMRRPRPPTET